MTETMFPSPARQWVLKAAHRLERYHDLRPLIPLLPRQSVTEWDMQELLIEANQKFLPVNAAVWQALHQHSQSPFNPTWQLEVKEGLIAAVHPIDTRTEMRELAKQADFEQPVTAIWNTIEHHCICYDLFPYMVNPKVIEVIANTSTQNLYHNLKTLSFTATPPTVMPLSA